MGMLVAFAAGCVVGARTGTQDFSDIKQSLQAIRASEEFRDLLTAMRTHGAQTLRSLADMVERSDGADGLVGPQDLVDRVRRITGREEHAVR